jgi:hypothetical protein
MPRYSSLIAASTQASIKARGCAQRGGQETGSDTPSSRQWRFFEKVVWFPGRRDPPQSRRVKSLLSSDHFSVDGRRSRWCTARRKGCLRNLLGLELVNVSG